MVLVLAAGQGHWTSHAQVFAPTSKSDTAAVEETPVADDDEPRVLVTADARAPSCFP